MSNKINSFYKYAILLLLLTPPLCNNAQDTALNKYNVLVISNYNWYQSTIRKDADKEMVDLKKNIPGILFDLCYTRKDNFTKKKLYPSLNTTFLRKPVAAALVSIQQELKLKGLGIKIFDAYRPYAVTEKMWELVKDERYAANPKNGSGHNRGIAVDLTIIDQHTKQALDMGTKFDNFSDTAHHNFTGLSTEVLQNRLLLRNVMEKNGFKALETEWWHYSFLNADKFELLNVGFNQLKRKIKTN